MTLIQESKDSELMGNLCFSVLELDGVRFVGVIDKLGNLVSSQFKSEISPMETEEKRRMMYMQMVLEISMRKDFDSTLGEVDYIASRRKNVLMVSIPINGYLLLVSTSPSGSAEKIFDYVSKIVS